MPEPAADDFTLKMARDLGGQGFRVVRVYEGDKRPVGLDWPRLATADVEVLTEQFMPGGLGLGVACGPQPNGRDLVVVDVDVKHDGIANWEAIVAEHGPFPQTATHRTPSGGLHLFWDSPETFSNSRLAPGIDIRGNGGQVVMPPSWRMIDGDKVLYSEAWRGSGLHRHPLAALPIPIWQMLVRPTRIEIEASARRHPSQDDEAVSNADWLRDHWDWLAVLEAQGHTLVKQIGRDLYMRHPTATAQHSAVVHLDGNMMNSFSPNMPDHPRGLVNRDGSVPWSPYDWFVATEHDYDDRSAMAEIYRRRGITMGAAPPARAVEAAPPSVNDTPALNLPTGFWEARPVLAHIRQAAWSAGCSPDALLVQALARVATYVHPCFKLPGVEQGLIGKHQTLDFLGCVVAETSGGKTLAAGVAELLVPAPDPPADGDPQIDFEQRVGSGEGIAEFFLVPEVRIEEGKEVRTGKRVVGKQALFMNVDEGTGFTNQAGRKGTTIIATLASAWSGESLGQLNAADETRRLVRGGRVRICAVINMQDTNGYKLYSEDLESVGFTGRLMFATAHDPSAPPPDEQPEWPGRLAWPIKAGNSQVNVYFTYDEAIVAEIKGTRHGILTRRVQIERRQSQYLLLRCKVAALLAVLDGRTDVSLDDWKLATEAITCSSAMLEMLDSVRNRQIEVTAVTAASFKMKVAESAEDQHLRRLAVGWKSRVVDELHTKGPLPWKGLKGLVRSDRRAMFRSIVDEMVSEGVLVLNGSSYEIGR